MRNRGQNERASLVAAIREEPEDDGPRLVCADWFEDQGTFADAARAEFIRLQVARSRLTENDDEWAEMLADEVRLLKAWGPTWQGAHHVLRRCTFRRGFIEHVHLHLVQFQQHRRQMLALEPIREVTLTGWWRARDELVRRVAACPEWNHIESLRIHHQGPHHDPRGNLVDLLESPHLERLVSLDATGNVSFDANDRRRFERLPLLRRIERLRLPFVDRWSANTGAWFDEEPGVIDTWEHLCELSLPSTLRDCEFEQFSQSATWQRLEKLHLCLPYPTAIRSDELFVERVPPGLSSTRVYVPQFPAPELVGSPIYECLSQLPLVDLTLSRFPTEPEDLGRVLSESSKCRLQSLVVEDWSMTIDHLLAVCTAPRAGDLRRLEFHVGEVGPAAAEVVARAGPLENLVELGLDGANLGADGLRVLGDRDWPTLRVLRLERSGMGARELIDLLRSNAGLRLSYLAYDEKEGSSGWLSSAEARAALSNAPHLVLVWSGYDGSETDHDDEQYTICNYSAKQATCHGRCPPHDTLREWVSRHA